MLTIDDPKALRYKGENHWLIAEETGMDPDQVLCMMAQWRPGYDENNQPYLRDDGTVDVERQDDELYDYIVYFWNLKIPRTKNPTCSGCTAPFKIIADAYFARYPLIIMQASRGASKSAMLTTLSATEMCTLACWIDVLGASEKQSLVIQSYLNNENPRTKGSWWDSPRAPMGLRDPKNDLVARQRLINGGQIEALTASHKTVRGRRPVRLRIDELDEAELHLIKSAQGCPRGDAAINAKAQTLMSSTHQHLDGTMSFYLNLAREQNKKVAETGKGVRIPIYKFCYRDVLTTNGGFIDPEEIEDLKATIDPETWDREFENNEPAAGGRIFRDHQIDYLFDKTWLAEPGRELLYEGAADTPIEIDFESATNKIFPEAQDVIHGGVREVKRRQKVRDHLGHFCGADYANDIDWSIFTRLTTNTLDSEEKYFLTGWYRTARRDTIKEIVHEYNEFVNAYENSMGAHDETGNKMVNDEIDCDSEPFTFSRISKKEILSLMIKMIQDKKIKGPYIDYAYKEFKYLTQDHINGKKHLPDSVASLALACYAASQVEHGGFECEAVFG